MEQIEGLFVVVIHWSTGYSDVYGPYLYNEAVENWSAHVSNLQEDQMTEVKLAKLSYLD